MKQYIGIIRDHSGSMAHISRPAMTDFNSNLAAMKEEARVRDIDTLVTVVEVGSSPRTDGKEFAVREVLTSVERVKQLNAYPTPGGSTPLFDGLSKLIDLLEAVPDKDGKDVAFLVMVITDGQENVNYRLGPVLGERIKGLQRTDKWTFTFRVPFGYAQGLASQLNIPRGNVMEWEQTRQGFEKATRVTQTATQAYYASRSMGVTSVDSFYANPANISKSTLKRKLDDITREVDILSVRKGGELIQPFVERETGKPYLRGAGFYQLTKPEPKVQSNKQIVIRERASGKVYGGSAARDLLGLPQVGTVKLSPGDHGGYDVFVQSTSVNRKLIAGTEVVYWPGVRR